MVMNDDLLLW